MRQAPLAGRRLGLLFVVGAVLVLALAYGLVAGGGQPNLRASEPVATPTATTSAERNGGGRRPAPADRAAIDRPGATGDRLDRRRGRRSDYLELAYFLDEVGSTGYNVGLSIVEPHGVYDPVLDEAEELPLPGRTSSAGSRTIPTSNRANPPS